MAPSTKASRPGSNARTPSDTSMAEPNILPNGHKAAIHDDESNMVRLFPATSCRYVTRGSTFDKSVAILHSFIPH